MAHLDLLDHPITFSHPKRLEPTTAWAGHIPFAFFLIDILRPDVVVELGTYTGVSYCAFCQAVQDLELATRCYAIDTWRGEKTGTMGAFDPEVLNDLKQHHDQRYGEFSRLLQSSFDDARGHFKDGTVDLLHIDGDHAYESVKHDLETWLPKMSDRGVVLFHDTNVRIDGFGVWRFWEELKPLYPHFEFVHEHGLGVIAVGQNIPEPLRRLFDGSPAEAVVWQKAFQRLGQRLSLSVERQVERKFLYDQLRESGRHVEKLAEQMQLKDLELQRRTLELQHQTTETQRWTDHAQNVSSELSRVQERLQSILNSRAWRWVSRYGRVKDRLLAR